MSRTTYSARITGPLHYTTSSGKQADVPLGPCLIEQVDGQRVDIVWGAKRREVRRAGIQGTRGRGRLRKPRMEHVVPAAHPCAVALWHLV